MKIFSTPIKRISVQIDPIDANTQQISISIILCVLALYK